MNAITSMSVMNYTSKTDWHPVGWVDVTFVRTDRARAYYEPTPSSMRRVIRAQARHMYAVLMSGKEAKS